MICNKCGSNIDENSKFCENCGTKVEKLKDENLKEDTIQTTTVAESEKLLPGIGGALIGSIAGVIAIILLDRIGYVASISGVIMSFCTISLYKKFAGSISKKGVIICIAIIIIMTLLAVNSSFSLQVVKEVKAEGYQTSFFYVFTNLYYLMNEGYLVNSTYFSSLFMIYLFTALGAFGTIKSEFKSLK